jgi:hypothetical protein
MSALPPKADIVRHCGNVRFVPKETFDDCARSRCTGRSAEGPGVSRIDPAHPAASMYHLNSFRSQLLQQASCYPLGVKWATWVSFFAERRFHFHNAILHRIRSGERMAVKFNGNLLPDSECLVGHGHYSSLNKNPSTISMSAPSPRVGGDAKSTLCTHSVANAP